MKAIKEQPTPEAQAALLARALRRSCSQAVRHGLEFALLEIARESNVWFSDPNTARALYLAVAKINARRRQTRRVQNSPLESMLMQINIALAKWQQGDLREAYALLRRFLPEDLRAIHDEIDSHHSTQREPETETEATPAGAIDLQCWRESHPR